eukprot:2538406-Rhodomonas_salina.1
MMLRRSHDAATAGTSSDGLDNEKDDIVVIAIVVDDVVITHNNASLYDETIAYFKKMYELRDIDKLN